MRACLTIISFSSALMKSRNRNTPLSGRPTAAEFWATVPAAISTILFRLADSASSEVHLFECAIDLLSYATLSKLSGRNWRQENLVSLAGVYLPKEKIEDSTTPPPLCDTLKKSRISGKSISILITTAQEGKRLRRCKSSCQSGTRSLTSRRRKAKDGIQKFKEKRAAQSLQKQTTGTCPK